MILAGGACSAEYSMKKNKIKNKKIPPKNINLKKE
jgi:hypothetical protein